MPRIAFIGSFIHCDDDENLRIVEKGLLIVENGKICDINNKFPDQCANGILADEVIVLNREQFLIPGFIDCHIHAVQYPNVGLGYDKGLLNWLEIYTFPLEKKFSDEEFANAVFDAIVKKCLSSGTTTACYFASLYTKASIILARKIVKHGQRAFVGKVNMNTNRSDEYYESTDTCIENTKSFIKNINELNCPLVKPIITPRFPLSCDMNLMTELGKLAKKENLHIQSHISETLDEISAVKDTFKLPTYAAVYDAAGLLTEKTILAHGVYLTDEEIELLKNRKTAIIHCPTSNTCLKSGLCNIQKLKSKGLKIGLGTDVAGGYSPSLLQVMRSTLDVSIHYSFQDKKYNALNYKEVFYMATLGGAKSLNIQNDVGNFQLGKQFDALLIDLNVPGNPIDNLMHYTLEENFQRFLYCGDDRNITSVFVNGNKVK